MPNPLTMRLAATGVALAACGISGLSLGASLAGLALGLALMLPGHLIGATGAGDVKLFAAVGALVGPAHIVIAFVYTALAGGGVALVVSLSRRRLRQTVGGTALLIVTAGANVAGDRKPAREQPVRVRPGHRRRRDAGGAGILTTRDNEGPDLWLACECSWCSCWR